MTRRLLLAAALPAAGLGGCGQPAAESRGVAQPAPAAGDGQASDGQAGRIARLVAAYPDHLAGVAGDDLVWRDGSRMAIGTGQAPRPFPEMLQAATIAEQLLQDYPPGPLGAPPPRDMSPGRLRNTAFFVKMYGDCSAGATAVPRRSVTWMPRTRPQSLSVTTVNGVDARLERVIATLETLPDRLKAHLVPSGGAYYCRAVADTGLRSMHGYGAAIDVAVRGSAYWLWARSRDTKVPPPGLPGEIVEAFEAEKFIWGGKWYHYDTMHFEYRPELFA